MTDEDFKYIDELRATIHRQEAEIEQLKKQIPIVAKQIRNKENFNAQSIKWFAEKLKSKLAFGLDTKISTAVYSFIYCTIDNLVKEMVGEDK